MIRRRVRSGRLPAEVRAAVAGAAEAGQNAGWENTALEAVTSALTLPASLARSLENSRPPEPAGHRTQNGHSARVVACRDPLACLPAGSSRRVAGRL